MKRKVKRLPERGNKETNEDNGEEIRWKEV